MAPLSLERPGHTAKMAVLRFGEAWTALPPRCLRSPNSPNQPLVVGSFRFRRSDWAADHNCRDRPQSAVAWFTRPPCGPGDSRSTTAYHRPAVWTRRLPKHYGQSAEVGTRQPNYLIAGIGMIKRLMGKKLIVRSGVPGLWPKTTSSPLMTTMGVRRWSLSRSSTHEMTVWVRCL